jgi:hypothetical protein
MEKLNLIKYLIRLSEISEIIEEQNPEAAGEIDGALEDIGANQDADDNPISPNLFPSPEYPRIETPTVNKNPEDTAKGIAREIENSPKLMEEVKEIIENHSEKEAKRKLEELAGKFT